MATWDEAVKQFSRVVDKLGKKIDDGIFEAVVTLNLLGVSTVASCEGHIGWGVPYPWIDIEAELGQKYRLHQLLSQFYEQRSVSLDSLLQFNGYRMRPAGAAFFSMLPEIEQKQKLVMYQAEMTAFTTFMKSLYWKGRGDDLQMFDRDREDDRYEMPNMQ